MASIEKVGMRFGVRHCSSKLALAFAAVVAVTSTITAEEFPRKAKQIVIFYTHRPVAPIYMDWDRGIRGALMAGYHEPLDIEIEYLNLVRYQDSEYLSAWIDLLKTKYAANPPDLIIPVFVPALQFALEHRASLFPGAPIVFCSVPSQLAESAHTQPNVTGVAFRFDLAGMLSAMAQLQPTTQRLMVLSGNPIDKESLKKAVPTIMSQLGQPDLREKLLDGHSLGDKRFLVHLDGVDQPALITGKGKSNRKEFYYITETKLHGLRYGDWKFLFVDQDKWFNGLQQKLVTPLIANLKLDPFERFHNSRGFDEWQENRSWTLGPAGAQAAKFMKLLRDYPPRQKSFDIDLDEMMKTMTEPGNRQWI